MIKNVGKFSGIDDIDLELEPGTDRCVCPTERPTQVNLKQQLSMLIRLLRPHPGLVARFTVGSLGRAAMTAASILLIQRVSRRRTRSRASFRI